LAQVVQVRKLLVAMDQILFFLQLHHRLEAAAGQKVKMEAEETIMVAQEDRAAGQLEVI
jgi:hypothetical protein